MVERRTIVGAIAVLLFLPLDIEAQQAGKVPRIGYIAQNSAELGQRQLTAFRQGLRERGWVEGENIVLEVRFAEGRVDRFPALIAEMIHLKVDVIVTTSSATTWVAKDATRSIPIVMAASADAPGEGLVASLRRPGGNITGMTFMAGPEIAGKQLQLLKEMAPSATSVAVLTNPTNRSHAAFLKELKVSARSLGLQIRVSEAQNPDQLDSVFAAMTKERVAALLVLTDAMFHGQQQWIVDRAAKARLPALYSQREFVDAGGLVSYGPSLRGMFHQAATPVDKILKGTKPSDIPIEQPTKFELVINRQTAENLGLTIPPSLLQLAEMIQ